MGSLIEAGYIPGAEVFGTVREYGKNSNWFRQHFDEMQERYAGQVVLVLNKEVVFSTEDTEEARRRLRSLGDQIDSCYVRCVPRVEEMRMM